MEEGAGGGRGGLRVPARNLDLLQERLAMMATSFEPLLGHAPLLRVSMNPAVRTSLIM